MNKRILVVVFFSIVAVAAIAQTSTTKPKAGAKKVATTSKTGKKIVAKAGVKRKPLKKGVAAVTPPQNKTTIAVTQTPLVDTVKKDVPVAVPAPNFKRPLDGFYTKNDVLNATPTPYPSLREADVLFSKTIWQEIDLREKINQYMDAPQSRLIDLLIDAINAGELTAYDTKPTKDDPDGDKFSGVLTPAQVMSNLVDSVWIDVLDKDGNKVGQRREANIFNPDSIVRYRIKEYWIFDKQRSIFEPRIIGLAPMIKHKVVGVEFDYQPAFWIYMPDARQVLASKEVALRHNDAMGLSYDQVFLKRMFHSYIVKESNEKDESIKDYEKGIDQLYEAERIKKSLMDWELNLWQY